MCKSYERDIINYKFFLTKFISFYNQHQNYSAFTNSLALSDVHISINEVWSL